MTVQHKDIPEAQLHEPKGISTAAVNKHYVANGVGSGTWQKILPPELNGVTTNGTAGQYVKVDGSGGFKLGFTDHGDIYFVNTGTPFEMTTATTTFSKCAPTTTGSGHAVEVTEGTTARLTYTGLDNEHFNVRCSMCVDQSTGANKNISIAFAKNGTVIAESEQITTTTTAEIHNLVAFTTVQLTTNDYIEVFVKISAAATVRVFTFSFSMWA